MKAVDDSATQGPASAAGDGGRTPGKGSTTSQVQRRAGARLTPPEGARVPAASPASPQVADDPFGLHLAGSAAEGKSSAVEGKAEGKGGAVQRKAAPRIATPGSPLEATELRDAVRSADPGSLDRELLAALAGSAVRDEVLATVLREHGAWQVNAVRYTAELVTTAAIPASPAILDALGDALPAVRADAAVARAGLRALLALLRVNVTQLVDDEVVLPLRRERCLALQALARELLADEVAGARRAPAGKAGDARRADAVALAVDLADVTRASQLLLEQLVGSWSGDGAVETATFYRQGDGLQGQLVLRDGGDRASPRLFTGGRLVGDQLVGHWSTAAGQVRQASLRLGFGAGGQVVTSLDDRELGFFSCRQTAASAGGIGDAHPRSWSIDGTWGGGAVRLYLRETPPRSGNFEGELPGRPIAITGGRLYGQGLERHSLVFDWASRVNRARGTGRLGFSVSEVVDVDELTGQLVQELGPDGQPQARSERLTVRRDAATYAESLERALAEVDAPPDPDAQLAAGRAAAQQAHATGDAEGKAADAKVERLAAGLDSTRGLERHPIKAAFVPFDDPHTVPLDVFVCKTFTHEDWAYDAKGAATPVVRETWRIVDLSNPADRRLTGEYEGIGPDAASALRLAALQWRELNGYARGLIQLQIAPEACGGKSPLTLDVPTTGERGLWATTKECLDALGGYAGYAALGLGVAAAVAVPALAPVALGALYTSLAASTAGATMGLVERHAMDGHSADYLQDALDVTTIVAGLCGATWARGATLKGFVGGRLSTAVVWGNVGATTVQAVLVAAQHLEELERIRAIPDEAQRHARMLAFVKELVLFGALQALAIRGAAADVRANAAARGSWASLAIEHEIQIKEQEAHTYPVGDGSALPEGCPDPAKGQEADAFAWFLAHGKGWKEIKQALGGDLGRLQLMRTVADEIFLYRLEDAARRVGVTLDLEASGTRKPTSDLDVTGRVSELRGREPRMSAVIEELNTRFRADYGIEAAIAFDANIYAGDRALAPSTDAQVVASEQRMGDTLAAQDALAAEVQVRRQATEPQWKQHVDDQLARARPDERALIADRLGKAERMAADLEADVHRRVPGVMEADEARNRARQAAGDDVKVALDHEEDVTRAAANQAYADQLRVIEDLQAEQRKLVEQLLELADRHPGRAALEGQLDQVTTHIGEEQIKARYLSPEAYLGTSTIRDVVGVQQKGEGLSIEIRGYGASMKEQAAESLKVLNLSTRTGGDPVKAFVDTSKYVNRLTAAADYILGAARGHVDVGELVAKVHRLAELNQPLFAHKGKPLLPAGHPGSDAAREAVAELAVLTGGDTPDAYAGFLLSLSDQVEALIRQQPAAPASASTLTGGRTAAARTADDDDR